MHWHQVEIDPDLKLSPEVRIVVSYMREEDVEEIQRFGGKVGFKDICENLEKLVGYPKAKLLVIYSPHYGHPIALAGVCPTEDASVNTGIVFAIPRFELDPLDKIFLMRSSKAILKELSEGFDLVHNIKYTGYNHHRKWLKHLGFTFLQTHQINGNSFQEFVKIP